MRARLSGFTAALVVAISMPSTAAAQVSAAGWVGAGMFGDDPAMTVDVGVDYATADLAFGLGGRVRFLNTGGFRERDWDEPSELLGLLRYVRYEHVGDENDVTVVAGRLGGVNLGHGTIFDGYESALNLDHRHLGMQSRVDTRHVRFDAVVDDVASPRLLGARGALLAGSRARFGATAAADLSAPSRDGDTVLPFFVLDASLSYTSDNEQESIRGYLDLVSIPRIGAGAHLGTSGRAGFGRLGDRFYVGARAELRLSGDGYVPGWIGPLYEVTRSRVGDTMMGQLDTARMTGRARLTALGALRFESDRFGRAEITYASRPMLPNLLYGRIVIPELGRIRAAFWGATELSSSGVSAAAFELRAKLNRHAFLVVEAAKLYRDGAMGIEPVWLGTVAIGASVGQ